MILVSNNLLNLSESRCPYLIICSIYESKLKNNVSDKSGSILALFKECKTT